MKFFLISNMYPSSDSPGYGIFVRNVADGLGENGVEMTYKAVISGRPKGKWEKICKYLKFGLATVRGFFSDYDFIYVHFPNQVIPLLQLLYLFRQPKIIVNFHGEDLLYANSGVHRWLGQSMESFCRKHAAGVVVPSPYFARLAADRNILPEDQIIVSPSGGIKERFFKPKRNGTVAGDVDSPIHLGYIGRLEPGKGILEFLSVLKRMTERDISYKATIVGYGTLSDAVEAFMAKINRTDDVAFIHGADQSELADYYNEFDLLLFLSSRSQESLGLAGIESMACGTPVIGSNVGGIESYLVDGVNGYLVTDVSDVDKIVDLIVGYRQMPQDKKLEMSDNAIATGKRYFSEGVCCQLAADIKKRLTSS